MPGEAINVRILIITIVSISRQLIDQANECLRLLGDPQLLHSNRRDGTQQRTQISQGTHRNDIARFVPDERVAKSRDTRNVTQRNDLVRRIEMVRRPGPR
jgi:hypothetical protein